MRKVAVEVVVRFSRDGEIIPLSITWEDGTVYEVDKVLDYRTGASLKIGVQGKRFTVRIKNKEVFLFMEISDRIRWYMEGK